MVTQEAPLCFKCGDHAHWTRNCGEVQIQRSKREASNRFAAIQERFKGRQEGNTSYAEALARNRSQSRGRSKGRKPTPLGYQRVENPDLADRVLNLEIQMSQIHKMVLEIGNR